MLAAEKEQNPIFAEYNSFIEAALFAAAVVNGFSLGILWASANNYIADCASEENKGFFFSYFWAFYMASQVFGNLIAAFVFKYLN